jgi:hypothetical protein
MDLVGYYKNIMAWLKKGDEKTGMALASVKKEKLSTDQSRLRR